VQASQGPREPEDELELPESLLRIPAFLMLQILRWGRRGAELSPEGPRLPYIAVLACLVEFGPQAQRDVSRRLQFDPSDVVAVVDALEEAGHAVRQPDPADRRRNAVAATPAGRRWLRGRLADAGRRAEALLPGLNTDERAQLVALLQRALAHLDRRVPERYRER
jgi:DNA-binding MarR family transcriptional regulator